MLNLSIQFREVVRKSKTPTVSAVDTYAHDAGLGSDQLVVFGRCDTNACVRKAVSHDRVNSLLLMAVHRRRLLARHDQPSLAIEIQGQ